VLESVRKREVLSQRRVGRGSIACGWAPNISGGIEMSITHRSLFSYCRCAGSARSHAAATPSNFRRVAARFAVTLPGAAAARRGFRRRAVRLTRHAKADRFCMNRRLALYGGDCAAGLRRGRTLNTLPQEVWMSRAESPRRYASWPSSRHARNRAQSRRSNTTPETAAQRLH
jgi:hypothetical protein